MRIRKSTGELVFTAKQFAALDFAQICRRYGLGSDWVDVEKDQAASKLVAPK